jgi:glycosyltransferase involved in cell wall biosynthesis
MPQKIYFDLSVLANTAAGSAVFAWELCHRLMRLAQPLQVIPVTCPFSTLEKTGLNRAVNAVLRDTIWQHWLVGKATVSDYFIFPNPLIVPPKFYNFPYAVFILDLGSWHNRLYLQWRGKLAVQALPKVLQSADQIFAISDYTAEDVAREFGIERQKIVVVPCGLSQIYQSKATQLSQINGIDLPQQYFLHVGTFEPKKNLPFLLEVYQRFRELTKDEHSIKLVLTGGESWNSSDFIQQIKHSPFQRDIIILGRVQAHELPALYRGATALIFPSIFEGFGLPVIEALSQEIPVLINDNTSLTQFSQFGATVLDHYESNLWAQKLKKIVNEKRSYSQDAERVKKYFDWDRAANIVAETIQL